MGLWGGLEGGETVEQYLDLNAVELLAHFFTTEEMKSNLRILELSAQEQALLKAALLQEIARQIQLLPALKTAIRNKVQGMANVLKPPTP